jgi:hypothetical protein
MVPLGPLVNRYKVFLILAGCGGLIATGATVEHWRMGKKVAEQAQKSTAEKLVRQTALTDRQQRAMQDSLRAVLDAHAALKAERARNRELVKASVAAAPTAPEFACRDLPLPETYLETFRQ